MFEQPVPRIEGEELLCGCATSKLFIYLFIHLFIYLFKERLCYLTNCPFSFVRRFLEREDSNKSES